MKIVYKIKKSDVIAWSHKLIDSNKYKLKKDEVFGDKFVKPILKKGIIVEGFNSNDILKLKAAKIKVLKKMANSRLQKNQWYYDRETKLSKLNKPLKNVPQFIIDEDTAIYNAVDLQEAEIISLKNYKAILNYDINL